jgi:hypothetical protein
MASLVENAVVVAWSDDGDDGSGEGGRERHPDVL